MNSIITACLFIISGILLNITIVPKQYVFLFLTVSFIILSFAGIFSKDFRKVEIFQIKGIPFYLSHFWLFMMSLIGYACAVINDFTGFYFVFIAYACVTVHEYGHALTAKFYNHKTESITLYPLAGVAEISMDSDNYKHEFWITINGPMTNLFMALLALPFIFGLGIDNKYITFFLEVNTSLLGFNLLPVYPMDGGRLVRCLLHSRTNMVTATNYAIWISITCCLILCPIMWMNQWGGASFVISLLCLMGVMESVSRNQKDRIERQLFESKKRSREIFEEVVDSEFAIAKEHILPLAAMNRHLDSADFLKRRLDVLDYFWDHRKIISEVIFERLEDNFANRKLEAASDVSLFYDKVKEVIKTTSVSDYEQLIQETQQLNVEDRSDFLRKRLLKAISFDN